jgi:hypothetical protein
LSPNLYIVECSSESSLKFTGWNNEKVVNGTSLGRGPSENLTTIDCARSELLTGEVAAVTSVSRIELEFISCDSKFGTDSFVITFIENKITPKAIVPNRIGIFLLVNDFE